MKYYYIFTISTTKPMTLLLHCRTNQPIRDSQHGWPWAWPTQHSPCTRGPFCDHTQSFKPIGSMYGIRYRYLHLPKKTTIHVGKYTSPMDTMGNIVSRKPCHIVKIMILSRFLWCLIWKVTSKGASGSKNRAIESIKNVLTSPNSLEIKSSTFWGTILCIAQKLKNSFG